MQLLIENTDGDQVVEVQIRRAAALQVVRPLVLRGNGGSSLAAALEGVQRSGVPCIVEESSGHAAELAHHVAVDVDLTDAVADDETRFAFQGEWTIAIWVGERNQHRWLRRSAEPASAELAPVVLERSNGGHKLVYFGDS
jgi:hypothetical protein